MEELLKENGFISVGKLHVNIRIEKKKGESLIIYEFL